MSFLSTFYLYRKKKVKKHYGVKEREHFLIWKKIASCTKNWKKLPQALVPADMQVLYAKLYVP